MARRFLVSALAVLTLLGSRAARASTPADDAFEEGNRLYNELRYAEALDSYRKVLAAGKRSAELFHNMGNAALQSGHAGWAVYYFEQARRRSPRNPDIGANLALTRRALLGSDPEPSRASILHWSARWVDTLTPARAAMTVLALVWLAVAAILCRWMVPPLEGRRRLLGIGAVAALALAGLLAGMKLAQQSLAPEAMVVQAGAARSEPSDDATVEFRLPAGSPVDLGREDGKWREVQVSESLRGWMEESAIAEFAAPR